MRKLTKTLQQIENGLNTRDSEELEINNFTRKENVLRELKQKLMQEKVAK